jgi:hypothetical protein
MGKINFPKNNGFLSDGIEKDKRHSEMMIKKLSKCNLV